MNSGTLDTLPVEILDDIFGLVQASEKLAIREVCSRFKNLIPLHIATLEFKKMVNTFHISATFPGGTPPLEFLSRPAKYDSERFNPATREITYFRAFAYPPTSNYSLFDFAEIDHFKMDQNLALHLYFANLEHLSNLLRGCTIKKLSLVFDEDSIMNVSDVVSLAERFHTRHVDFILARIRDHHSLARFMHGGLACALVLAGVKEVTFSGEKVFSCSSYYNQGFLHQPIFSLELLLTFFKSGIERITVNPDALIAGDIKTNIVEKFISKLATLGKRLHLDLHACLFYEELSERRFHTIKGVKTAKTSRQRHYRIFTPSGTLVSTPTLLSIECDGTGNT